MFGMLLKTGFFFPIINHGILKSVLVEMIDGVRGFHEMESEEKSKYYSRDYQKQFSYVSNYHLFTGDATIWLDSFLSVMAPKCPRFEELPPICRDIITVYSNHIMKLGHTLLELFSMALGLEPNHLESLGCAHGLYLLGHYYPHCPQPDLTFGATCHTDSGFITIVLQDLLGVLHKGKIMFTEGLDTNAVRWVKEVAHCDDNGSLIVLDFVRRVERRIQKHELVQLTYLTKLSWGITSRSIWELLCVRFGCREILKEERNHREESVIWTISSERI
ncbi:hypothetical protein L6452_10521 [Arctium lappa]|uniref:Uncharacterized protein n=1 Tax=Arctium lappa TaxID=4217 RepID=A0ACB9DNH2_ARCLA|nr:hypothetical protein L6452_10521 [Arctium lappa]